MNWVKKRVLEKQEIFRLVANELYLLILVPLYS
jgi:hypothetical protein